MASKELQLVSRIIYSGDLRSVLEWGVTTDDFITSEGRAFFSHILGYHAKAATAGSVLGAQFVQANYPHFFRCDDTGMTTEALCLEVRKERISIELKNMLDEVRQLSEHDPVLALSALQAETNKLQNIGTGRSTDMLIGAAANLVLNRYECLKRGENLSVCPWPWAIMNEVALGFQPDDYVVFYGRPKSFKSWVLAYIIAWVFDQGKRALIYTKEMTSENIFARVIACIAGINYQGLRTGKLATEEESALYSAKQFLDSMQAGNNVICLSGQDAPEGGDTVPWLRSKVEKFNPDFIFIDGMYLMSDTQRAKKDNERVRNISRDLRQMNLSLKKPLICTLQANRAAAKHGDANLDEIAFSDAIGQDATHIMRVINEHGSSTCQLVTGGAREFHLNGFRINAQPAYDFSFHSHVSEKEINNAKKNDTGESDNPKAHAIKRTPTTEAQALNGVGKRIEKM